jgi:hypothetical protein
MTSYRKMMHGPADRSCIDVNEPFELRYWCWEFDVTPRDLRRVIGRVGPTVDDVKEELARMGAHGFLGSARALADDATDQRR